MEEAPPAPKDKLTSLWRRITRAKESKPETENLPQFEEEVPGKKYDFQGAAHHEVLETLPHYFSLKLYGNREKRESYQPGLNEAVEEVKRRASEPPDSEKKLVTVALQTTTTYESTDRRGAVHGSSRTRQGITPVTESRGVRPTLPTHVVGNLEAASVFLNKFPPLNENGNPVEVSQDEKGRLAFKKEGPRVSRRRPPAIRRFYKTSNPNINWIEELGTIILVSGPANKARRYPIKETFQSRHPEPWTSGN